MSSSSLFPGLLWASRRPSTLHIQLPHSPKGVTLFSPLDMPIPSQSSPHYMFQSLHTTSAGIFSTAYSVLPGNNACNGASSCRSWSESPGLSQSLPSSRRHRGGPPKHSRHKHCLCASLPTTSGTLPLPSSSSPFTRFLRSLTSHPDSRIPSPPHLCLSFHSISISIFGHRPPSGL